MKANKASLTQNISILLIIVLCTIWTVVGYGVYKIHDDGHNNSAIVAQNLVRSLAAHTEVSFKVIGLQLKEVAKDLDRLGSQPIMSEDITQVLAQRVKALEPLLSIGIVDDKANLVQAAIPDNNGGYLKVKPINVMDREYYQAFAHISDLKQASLFIGRPIQGRINGVWFVPVAQPRIASDGTFAGVVLGTIKLNTFGNLYESFELPTNASIALARDDGTFIYRMPFKMQFFERTFEDNPFFKNVLPTSFQGVYDERSSIDQRERIITYQRLKTLPLVVVVTQTHESMTQEFWAEAMIEIVTGLLATLALVYFSRLIWLQTDTIIMQRNSLEETVEARTRELSEANSKLKEQALIDGLTGAANRRHLEERLEIEFRRAQRNQKPISVVMIDVDYFKKYNDTYGHLMGDDCLKFIVGILKENTKRPTDMVARYGGEEFCCLLPETNAEAASLLAETVRRIIENSSIGSGVTGEDTRVTVSIGVATVIPDQNNTVLQLIGQADQALYRAKGEGRNLVRHAGVSPSTANGLRV